MAKDKERKEHGHEKHDKHEHQASASHEKREHGHEKREHGHEKRELGHEGASKVTTDHEMIRKWVEARGGHPAAVAETRHGDDPGMLRIDFPGYSGEQRLEQISWDEFFQKFDQKGLKFLYQDEMREGQPSRFWKLIYGGAEEKREERPERKAS